MIKIKSLRAIWFIPLIVVTSIFGVSCQSEMDNNQITYQYVESNHPAFDSLADMAKQTPIILIGTKQEEINPYEFVDDTGRTVSEFSMAYIKLDQLIKSQPDRSIDGEELIPVLENEYQKDNTVYHVGGYQKMVPGEQYLLFLNYSQDDDWYTINGVVFGKVPLDPDEALLFNHPGADHEQAEKVIREVQESYKDFFWLKLP